MTYSFAVQRATCCQGEAKQSVVSFVERLAARVRSSQRSHSVAAN